MSPTKEGLFHLGLEPQAIWPTHTQIAPAQLSAAKHTNTVSFLCQIVMQKL